MGYSSDSIISAVRINTATKEQARVNAADITEPDNDHFHYYCADCFDRGQHVRLKHVKASMRTNAFVHWNKITEQPVRDENGEVRTREKTHRFPAHFDRWPGTKDHRCDQPVRYAAFRQAALYNNAMQTGLYSFVFPIRLPGRGGWNDHGGQRPTDLRSSFRPAGMELGGVHDAISFKKLLTYFERDPGLQHFQHFHDGYKLRKFEENFFESPLALYTYLQGEQAIGRNAAVTVAYLLDPNNSTHTGLHYLEGFVDRSVPVLGDGEKLKLFVRGMNRPAEKLLADMGRRHNWTSSHILVFGEARIDKNNPHHVEVEFYNPAQIEPWDDEMRFVRKFKPGSDAQTSLEI